MIDPDALLNDLKPQVRALENDLRDRAGEERFDVPLRAEWDKAVRRNRTAATYETWLEDQVTQSAVAWVLSTVFLRFCEDNRLIDDVFLSGRGERLDLAKERQQHFFEQPEHASETDREWIVEGLDAMSKASPVAAGLFDRNHNPMWRITPSLEGAKALIDFWRRSRPALPEEGLEVATVPVHDFTDPKWNTRFLGNLYQDLSEHAKKKYALLQTPEFVEEFILSLTLDEAINEFGLDPEPPEACPEELNLPRGLRVIDPTCGSGHFLLGAFEHLVEKLRAARPYDDKWDVVQRALYSVHGVDKNPFAVAIARFRMLIAAMQAGEVKRLKDAPEFALNIAVGDSLIHGRGGPDLDQGRWEFDANGELAEPEPVFTYATEDISDYAKTVDLLGVGSYHVVVGNPPYITVKDKTENKNYRVYKSCSGAYALSVPFAERFFQLAIRAGQDRRGAGYVGQITANSFMKREFGKKLIEEFFPTVRLTHIIDASGAYIPGHGTPTVILVGRRVFPRGESIRAVLGIRGEPSQPNDPARGHVWRAIETQTADPGTETNWLSVADLTPDAFQKHPWSLTGGGAAALISTLTTNKSDLLKNHVRLIGRTAHTGSDDAYFAPPGTWQRLGVSAAKIVPLVEGEMVRDWSLEAATEALFPYNSNLSASIEDTGVEHCLWMQRTGLRARREPGGTHEEIGLTWYEWSRWHPERYKIPIGIAMAFVATHCHFAMDRGGKVYKQSTPVIKLPDGATEEEHLHLLGILNSSSACFWLKMVSHAKGGTDNSSGGGNRWTPEAWIDRYEFTGTKLEQLPLPQDSPSQLSRTLDELAQLQASNTPFAICEAQTPSGIVLNEAHAAWASTQERMISLHEELDWEVYQLYGLLTEEEAAALVANLDSVPRVKLGERAFEIVLARKMAAGEIETQWFARHGSSPVTEVPQHWPDDYRRVVEKRIEAIEKLPQTIGLIERPEYKRRWASEPWEKKEKDALRNWLLDRCEAHELWFAADEIGQEQPRMMTVGRLADRLQDDADFVSVARLYAGEDVELLDVLKDILDAEHVPFIPAYRYKDSGLRKRAQWEQTWRLQRQEDETGEQLDIKVPPKYTGADFLKHSYWRNRGKLDVPKERFISYPDASPDGDDTLLLGWAGWDHAQQAHALVTLIEERTTRDGWELDRLMPLLAGLDEVLPWVKQWYGEVDPETGLSPAVAYEGYLQEQVEKYPGLSREELAKWRPLKKTRGRGARKKKADE
ncbi:BREX-2 system adenine-specific DNA-methyltransferase PglX [Actinomadura geliboluensis]|uniref:BREX-2 system adenine-specific DNA-methyltransferase PglX n=1 Tax=Actinomadura geliboluensis TaxID=882440 RepID=UPI00261EEC2C|nr:BREX-2 system adenine-specific DNA-methyltransferase PglX [Actinomadura geliboluensis]